MLSAPAAAFLNTLLMEAADQVVVGDGYVNVLDRGTADEIRAQLQAWRDQLTSPAPVVSRALVEEAWGLLSGFPDLKRAAAARPNDTDLGEALRAEAAALSESLARARQLLEEALG